MYILIFSFSGKQTKRQKNNTELKMHWKGPEDPEGE